LAIAPQPQAMLGPGDVRIEVRAAGLTLHDLLCVLGVGLDELEPIGSQAAGVVLECGTEVVDWVPGQRVMGFVEPAFAPRAVVERDALVAIPSGMSFAQAASIPIPFALAYYGLVELARLQPGERVLIHAADGGLGSAALHLARQLGALVFATADPSHWPVLRALGIPDEQLASSRDLGFEAKFCSAADGGGMHVVLTSLPPEFNAASLRLLVQGGRFVELGASDAREAVERAGATHRALLLREAGYARLQPILRELVALFEQGALSAALPSVWDVRRAPDAFRHRAELAPRAAR
jgi:NADPH:quinone reductase-like Zn-dependent oxidoreductase